MHIILMADDSGSMSDGSSPTPAQLVTEGIRNWILELQMLTKGGKKSYFAFTCIVFGSHAEPLVEWAWVHDIDASQLLIDGTSGTTNMVEAFSLARDILLKPCPLKGAPPLTAWNEPFVFLYSDGAPTDADGHISDGRDVLSAAQALKALRLPCGSPFVITLGFGGGVNTTLMRQIASTPGAYKHCESAAELAKLLPAVGTIATGGGGRATTDAWKARVSGLEL
ncbi:MAG: vWA domain-containing protein [Myxococcales bacterium]